MDPKLCCLCGYLTFDEEVLEEHILDEHADVFKSIPDQSYIDLDIEDTKLQNEPYVNISGFFCSYCSFKATTRQLLGFHIQKCHILRFVGREKTKKPYSRPQTLVCSSCTFETTDSEILFQHTERVHKRKKKKIWVSERIYECSDCDYKSNKTFNLLRHYKTLHLDDDGFICDHCPASFKEKSEFTKHVLKHRSENKSHTRISLTSTTTSSTPPPVQKVFCDQCTFSSQNSSEVEKHKETFHPKQTDFANYVTRTLLKSLGTEQTSVQKSKELKAFKRKSEEISKSLENGCVNHKKKSKIVERRQSDQGANRTEPANMEQNDFASYVTRKLVKSLGADEQSEHSSASSLKVKPVHPKVKPADLKVKPADPKVKTAEPKVKPDEPKVKTAEPKVKPADLKVKPAHPKKVKQKLVEETPPAEKHSPDMGDAVNYVTRTLLKSLTTCEQKISSHDKPSTNKKASKLNKTPEAKIKTENFEQEKSGGNKGKPTLTDAKTKCKTETKDQVMKSDHPIGPTKIKTEKMDYEDSGGVSYVTRTLIKSLTTDSGSSTSPSDKKPVAKSKVQANDTENEPLRPRKKEEPKVKPEPVEFVDDPSESVNYLTRTLIKSLGDSSVPTQNKSVSKKKVVPRPDKKLAKIFEGKIPDKKIRKKGQAVDDISKPDKKSRKLAQIFEGKVTIEKEKRKSESCDFNRSPTNRLTSDSNRSPTNRLTSSPKVESPKKAANPPKPPKVEYSSKAAPTPKPNQESNQQDFASYVTRHLVKKISSDPIEPSVPVVHLKSNGILEDSESENYFSDQHLKRDDDGENREGDFANYVTRKLVKNLDHAHDGGVDDDEDEPLNKTFPQRVKKKKKKPVKKNDKRKSEPASSKTVVKKPTSKSAIHKPVERDNGETTKIPKTVPKRRVSTASGAKGSRVRRKWHNLPSAITVDEKFDLFLQSCPESQFPTHSKPVDPNYNNTSADSDWDMSLTDSDFKLRDSDDLNTTFESSGPAKKSKAVKAKQKVKTKRSSSSAAPKIRPDLPAPKNPAKGQQNISRLTKRSSSSSSNEDDEPCAKSRPPGSNVIDYPSDLDESDCAMYVTRRLVKSLPN